MYNSTNSNILGSIQFMRKRAFTLAEVLITLGIIGVVVAMTMPSLIQKRTNSEVEAKLKKIYSVMNQAILLSEQDNGPKEYWPRSCSDTSCEDYYNQYIISYLNKTSVIKFQSFGGTNIAIFFTDGTVLIGKSGYDYFFFPNAKNFDPETFASMTESGGISSRKDAGIKYFSFQFTPSYNDENHKFHYKKGFEPYKAFLNVFSKQELTGPNAYACRSDAALKVWCTALIQLNGWKIPEDYPFKVK